MAATEVVRTDGRTFADFQASLGPNPTETDLQDPEFLAVWQAIKGWDIQRHPGDGYAGAMGNDVMAILKAVRSAQATLPCAVCGAATWNDEATDTILCLECTQGNNPA